MSVGPYASSIEHTPNAVTPTTIAPPGTFGHEPADSIVIVTFAGILSNVGRWLSMCETPFKSKVEHEHENEHQGGRSSYARIAKWLELPDT